MLNTTHTIKHFEATSATLFTLFNSPGKLLETVVKKGEGGSEWDSLVGKKGMLLRILLAISLYCQIQIKTLVF